MLKTIRVLLIATFIVLGTASCSSPSVGITPVPSLINTFLPPTITPTQPQTTATETQLPTESDYCYLSPNLLPISDAQGLNEDEIAGKLIDLYLAYFNVLQAPDYCRLDEYHIDKVYYDKIILLYEPKADFVRKVLFSIKPVWLSNFWMSMQGELDQQNWLHLGANVAVFRSDSGYTMRFARP